jgi:hypothetical protein
VSGAACEAGKQIGPGDAWDARAERPGKPEHRNVEVRRLPEGAELLGVNVERRERAHLEPDLSTDARIVQVPDSVADPPPPRLGRALVDASILERDELVEFGMSVRCSRIAMAAPRTLRGPARDGGGDSGRLGRCLL